MGCQTALNAFQSNAIQSVHDSRLSESEGSLIEREHKPCILGEVIEL
jgi:hypothetical protein